MTYEVFLRLIMTYKKSEENCREWYKFGIDIHEGKYPISTYLYGLMKAGYETTYTKEGINWIDWFIFENEYGQKDWSKGKTFEDKGDADGNPIAYSYESLYELLEKDYKLKTT